MALTMMQRRCTFGSVGEGNGTSKGGYVVDSAAPAIERALDADRRTIQSVDRACLILGYIADRQEAGVSLGDIAGVLGVHKSTAHRLLASFESSGLVRREPATGRYQLGLGTVALAGSLLGSLTILRIADPQIRRLAEVTQQTVNLGVRYRLEIINIEQIPAPDVRRSPDWLGKRAPLHVGAAAKALLAHLGEDEISRYVTSASSSFSAGKRESLLRELEEIRRRGFAINQGEVNPSVRAVGAPVFDASGKCSASISIAWYEHGEPPGLVPTRLDEFAGALVQTAQTISHQLGHNVQHIAWLA
jgi:DNA-binding IclR family transcriptional regulator